MKSKKGLIHRPCPICSSRDESHVFAEENFDPARLDEFAFASRKIPENMHYRLILCPACDALYSNPIPTHNVLSKAYHEAAFDSADEAHHAAQTYSKLLPAIANSIPGKQGALDIGTGDGAFLIQLLEKGFTGVSGVEPSVAPIRAAQEKIRPLIRHSLFKPAQFKKNSLNLVTCFQTFEHLFEPLQMCQGAQRILRKGGAFYAVFHNRRSFSARLLGFKSPIYDIEHLQLFSPASARFMMERAGFARIEVKPIFNTYPLHYWIKLLPFPLGIKKALMAGLKKIGLGYLPIPLPAGNMAVIGYKK